MEINKNMKIIVVDDQSTMRTLIRSVLRQLGYSNIFEAEGVNHAWAILQKEKIEFVVLDWNMPKRPGIELLQEIRASSQFSNLPVLMVTAEAKQENIIEAIKAKVNGYIVKPINAATMAEKMDSIFKKK